MKRHIIQFIKKYYSITLFTVVMSFFIWIFCYAIYNIAIGYNYSNNKSLDNLLMCLCSVAALFYIGILIKGWLIKFDYDKEEETSDKNFCG